MDIVQLLDELEDLIDESAHVPFTKKISIDPNEVFEIIKDIRNSLPEEIREAKWLNGERDRILSEAKAKADQLKKKAEDELEASREEMRKKFQELVNENTAVIVANEKAKEIVAEAQRTADAIKKGSFQYVDELLANTQDSLKTVIANIDKNRQELNVDNL